MRRQNSSYSTVSGMGTKDFLARLISCACHSHTEACNLFPCMAAILAGCSSRDGSTLSRWVRLLMQSKIWLLSSCTNVGPRTMRMSSQYTNPCRSSPLNIFLVKYCRSCGMSHAPHFEAGSLAARGLLPRLAVLELVAS